MNQSRPQFARWLAQTNDITRMFLAADRIPDLINMAGGLPEPQVYPDAELANLAAEAIRQTPQDALNYSPIEGLPDLRELIADRFSVDALRLTADNVLIVSGGMQGLDLVGKVLLDEGQLIAAQSPTYLGALDAWRPRQPEIRPMVLEQSGFDPAGAIDGAQFAYTVPNFSNPSGQLVDTSLRLALVRAAQSTGTWLVEDDPYGTLYYDGPPLPRMLTLSAEQHDIPYAGPVIYLGTLSKELAPGLRTGWVIASTDMIKALTIAKQGSDMCTSGLNQRIALDALRNGLDKRALGKILATYRQRRDVLCEAMDIHLSPWLSWQKPVGGMFVWATAKDSKVDTDKLLTVAMQARVCITPSSVFDPQGINRNAMRINFTKNPPDKLVEGVKRLAFALQTYTDKL